MSKINAFSAAQAALKTAEWAESATHADPLTGKRMAAFVKVKGKDGKMHETNTLGFTKTGRESFSQEAEKATGEQLSKAEFQGSASNMQAMAVSAISQGHGVSEKIAIAKDMYNKGMISVANGSNGKPNFGLVVNDKGEVDANGFSVANGDKVAFGVGMSAGEKLTGMQGVMIGGREIKLAKGVVSSAKNTGSVDTEGQEYTDITGASMKNPGTGLIMHGSEAIGMPIGQEGAHDLAIGAGVIAVIKGGEWINSKTKRPVFKKNNDGSYTTSDGNKATMNESGEFVGEDGKVVDKKDIQTTDRTWGGSLREQARNGLNSIGDKLNLPRKSPTREEVSDPLSSTQKDSPNQNNPKTDNATQGEFKNQNTPPKQNTTGSSPSNTHNDTTKMF
jgi:hypothetical protein